MEAGLHLRQEVRPVCTLAERDRPAAGVHAQRGVDGRPASVTCHGVTATKIEVIQQGDRAPHGPVVSVPDARRPIDRRDQAPGAALPGAAWLADIDLGAFDAKGAGVGRALDDEVAPEILRGEVCRRLEGNDGLTARGQQELGGAGEFLVSEPEGCRSAMRRHTGERAVRRQEIEGRRIVGHDCDCRRLAGTWSVGVELIVGRRNDDRSADLQQGLALRLSILRGPNLYRAHRRVRRVESWRRRSGACCGRRSLCIPGNVYLSGNAAAASDQAGMCMIALGDHSVLYRTWSPAFRLFGNSPKRFRPVMYRSRTRRPRTTDPKDSLRRTPRRYTYRCHNIINRFPAVAAEPVSDAVPFSTRVRRSADRRSRKS